MFRDFTRVNDGRWHDVTVKLRKITGSETRLEVELDENSDFATTINGGITDFVNVQQVQVYKQIIVVCCN